MFPLPEMFSRSAQPHLGIFSWLRWGPVTTVQKGLVGVALAAWMCSAGNEQVVQLGQKPQETNNPNGTGLAGVDFTGVTRQQEAGHDSEKSTD